MPLVPEPFEKVSVSTQAVFARSTPMARTWARFCPNLDIVQYREPLSEEKKTELNRRTSKLVRRACGNQLYKSSEFGWEVCSWFDVFGLVMDDRALRMDKRPYEFVQTDDSGQRTVELWIPDATLGLTTFDDFALERCFGCSVTDCKEQHGEKQPDRRLSQDRLHGMMHNPQCGLVVDGAWGKTDLAFPYAVYEAKKRGAGYDEAKQQIYHACRTYLGMLDDLVRDPDNVAEYQTKNSKNYQLFAFMSCGSYWEVYIAWNFFNSCLVETIWQGDVKEFSRAYDLICIVDQIHDYAVNDHREFVMKHLEAWHVRHEKTRQPSTSSVRTPPAGRKSTDGASDHSELSESDGIDLQDGNKRRDCEENLDRLMDFDRGMPEWFLLKEKSKFARQVKAQATRARNRKLQRSSSFSDTDDDSPQQKQGPSRPPTIKTRATKKAPPIKRGPAQKKGVKVVKSANTSLRVTRSSARKNITVG